MLPKRGDDHDKYTNEEKFKLVLIPIVCFAFSVTDWHREHRIHI